MSYCNFRDYKIVQRGNKFAIKGIITSKFLIFSNDYECYLSLGGCYGDSGITFNYKEAHWTTKEYCESIIKRWDKEAKEKKSFENDTEKVVS